MFKSGEFISEHIRPHDGGELDEEQIQPQGVELTIDEILSIDGTAKLSNDGYEKPERRSLQAITTEEYHTGPIPRDTERYQLIPSIQGPSYVVVYNEEIEIPEKHIGFVYPRSRLLRCGMHLTSAVWEACYKGRGEGALYTFNPVQIQGDMAMGQIVMCRASHHRDYDGSHQGERLEGHAVEP